MAKNKRLGRTSRQNACFYTGAAGQKLEYGVLVWRMVGFHRLRTANEARSNDAESYHQARLNPSKVGGSSPCIS